MPPSACPGTYSIRPSPAPGLFDVKYACDRYLPDRLVKRRIRGDVERVATENVGGLSFEGFAIFENHSPYSVAVQPRHIQDGFYGSLQALQGYRNTYYAGAAFQTHSSAAVWAHVEELLDVM